MPATREASIFNGQLNSPGGSQPQQTSKSPAVITLRHLIKYFLIHETEVIQFASKPTKVI